MSSDEERKSREFDGYKFKHDVGNYLRSRHLAYDTSDEKTPLGAFLNLITVVMNHHDTSDVICGVIGALADQKIMSVTENALIKEQVIEMNNWSSSLYSRIQAIESAFSHFGGVDAALTAVRIETERKANDRIKEMETQLNDTFTKRANEILVNMESAHRRELDEAMDQFKAHSANMRGVFLSELKNL